MTHCLLEVVIAVSADAGLFIRGDISGIDGADRGCHRQPAGKGFTLFAGVAGDAVSRARQIFAAFDQIAGTVVGRHRARGCSQQAQRQ